jgi:hypothetical protein
MAQRWYMRGLTALALIMGFVGTALCKAPTAVPSSATAYAITVQESWITLPDGVKLSVTLYAPTPKTRGERFPAILEYLPYRKDESTNHAPVHRYFAEHGFVSAHVDIRGTGRSQGQLIAREYTEREQMDAEAVIAWLAHQPWSNGNVGMFGISWGGFNSIQLAMRNPPGLKAIIAIDATEQLFREDVHFLDGMMHTDEYELNVDMLGSMTRSPDFPTDEASLAERFDTPPWYIAYKEHPRNGPFWDAPVRALSTIQIPVYLIGGMLDGYRDSIPRMLEQVQSPVRALLGPWNHSEPHDAVPGPAIEWRDIAVEWWAHWLKGEANGAMDRPKLSVYMNHSDPPDLQLRTIPGEWRAEAGWPPAGLRHETLYLGPDHSLHDAPTASGVHTLAYRPAATQESGGPDFWWGDIWGDQRSVDAYSLTYDSPVLKDELSILGRPRVCLAAAASAPTAHWFARVSDVAPDGTTTLVAGAGLAGAHRDSDRNPTPLEPGHEYALCLDLHLTSWVFPPGHHLRVAVSNAMWPMVWPTPDPMSTTLRFGGALGSRIELPVVPAKSALPPPTFAAVQETSSSTDADEGLNVSSNVPGLKWTISRDPGTQTAKVEWRGGSSTDFDWGHEDVHESMTYEADDLHPEKSAVHGVSETVVKLPNRELIWRATLDTTSDHDHFYVTLRRELYENGTLKRERSWSSTIPRDGQ